MDTCMTKRPRGGMTIVRPETPGDDDVTISTEPATELDAEQPVGNDLIRYIYAKHGASLMSFVLRKVGGDWQRAEDIVQETIVRAWRNGERFDLGRPLRPWLFTVARRLIIDEYRSRSARPEEPSNDEPQALVVQDETSNVHSAMLIEQVLPILSPAHLEIIVELYFRGRRPVDVATVLNIPVGTVKSRCFYALRVLREALEQQGVTDIAA